MTSMPGEWKKQKKKTTKKKLQPKAKWVKND